MLNAPKGALYECRCGLRINRQLNAAINPYLQMEGLTPIPKLLDELMGAWRCFALTGEKAEGSSHEPEGSSMPVNPKSYVCLSKAK